jgi:hypothetical protein
MHGSNACSPENTGRKTGGKAWGSQGSHALSAAFTHCCWIAIARERNQKPGANFAAGRKSPVSIS